MLPGSPSLWYYRAQPIRVLDGGGIEVMLDLGFYHFYRAKLLITRPDKRARAGTPTRAIVGNWLFAAIQEASGDEWPLRIRCEREGDRFFATFLRTSDGDCLNDILAARGELIEWEP